jgi:hypothetical protein
MSEIIGKTFNCVSKIDRQSWVTFRYNGRTFACVSKHTVSLSYCQKSKKRLLITCLKSVAMAGLLSEVLAESQRQSSVTRQCYCKTSM